MKSAMINMSGSSYEIKLIFKFNNLHYSNGQSSISKLLALDSLDISGNITTPNF